MSSILISLHPQHADAILEGKKTVEIRKKIGNRFEAGTLVYMYSTKPKQMISGSFTICNIERVEIESNSVDLLLDKACLTFSELKLYLGGVAFFYAIHVHDVINCSRPLSLKELKVMGISPPQSFCYIDSETFFKRIKKCM